MTTMEYSVSYSSSSSTGANGRIVLSDKGSGSNGKGADSKNEGVVITPEPSMVIKTRLMRRGGSEFSSDSARSFLNIAGDGSSGVGDENNAGNFEAKVFINVCSHELITLPTKRKTIDDAGAEVDGWHLPMSMGELRPCFDKNGNAAIVADCIMNPRVVEDMATDSNHSHFVCDLVIQCANRKFSKACFGGLELDKRYKVPKMKYAGYVDDKTGLPTDSKFIGPDSNSRPVVAKQRVKGNGGRRPIIEEIDSATANASVQQTKSLNATKVQRKETSRLPMFRIELFIEIRDCDKECIPLFDYLKAVAHELPSGTLMKRIATPDLKQNAPTDPSALHPSQLLKTPIPYSFNSLQAKHGVVSSVIARCANAASNIAVEVSAFQLTLSSPHHSKTECVLPFPVDSHKAKCSFDAETKTMEMKLSLLESSLGAEDGPDPGTKQWELSNAFSRGLGAPNKAEVGADSSIHEQQGYFHGESDTESVDENQQLPEDAFHSRDALSRHFIQQQEEEREAKTANHEQMLSNPDEDVEVINIQDLLPGGKYYYFASQERTNGNDTLRTEALNRGDNESVAVNYFGLGLV